MEHFICTGGCGGVSGTPGVCQAESCPLHGLDLKPCGCTDGEHADVKAAAELEERRKEEEDSD
ncbi:MAG: hypothetical protein HY445_02665 [Candidatus Niyogibacteria bacterium]|nr:hypothetical protein [Candidatus Niyogibacteria bacterium]